MPSRLTWKKLWNKSILFYRFFEAKFQITWGLLLKTPTESNVQPRFKTRWLVLYYPRNLNSISWDRAHVKMFFLLHLSMSSSIVFIMVEWVVSQKVVQYGNPFRFEHSSSLHGAQAIWVPVWIVCYPVIKCETLLALRQPDIGTRNDIFYPKRFSGGLFMNPG